MLACLSYTLFSGALVHFTNSQQLQAHAFGIAMVLLAVAGAFALCAIATVPALRQQVRAVASNRTVGILAVLALLIVSTHSLVYASIVHAPNAGYAQAIVNVSALLLAVGMWFWFRQPLGAVALGGIVLITIGSVLLKIGVGAG